MPHKHASNPELDSIVHCQNCNLTIAGISAGLVIIRRDRTELVAERIHSIRCHRCGQNNVIAPVSPMASVTSSFAVSA